jgi:hypothetical protein
MASQKLVFVTKRSKITYEITSDNTCNLKERRIPRSFIAKESSTIFNFLEDFPNEDFEFPIPFDVTEEEVGLLFYFLTVYSWEVSPQKYYSEYFLDKPDFWTDAYKMAKKDSIRGHTYRGIHDEIYLLEKYILKFLSFEFGSKQYENVFRFNSSDLCKESFGHCFTMGIEDPFKLKLLFDLYNYYLQIEGRTSYIDTDVLTFLSMFENAQKNSEEDLEKDLKDYDNADHWVNVWNNPVLYLVADFCGFDSFVSYFEKIGFYEKWTKRQKKIASTNASFFTRFACIPYFLKSFGKDNKDANLITKLFYEEGESAAKEYEKRKFSQKYHYMSHNADFDGDCINICCGHGPIGYYYPPMGSSDTCKFLAEIYTYFELTRFMKDEPLIAERALQNLDFETKLFLGSITSMRKEVSAIITLCDYESIAIFLNYKPHPKPMLLKDPKIHYEPPKRQFIKQHTKKVYRHPGGR